MSRSFFKARVLRVAKSCDLTKLQSCLGGVIPVNLMRCVSQNEVEFKILPDKKFPRASCQSRPFVAAALQGKNKCINEMISQL